MNKAVYDYYVNNEHHKLRTEFHGDTPAQYREKGFSFIERTTDRFERLCKAQTPVIRDGELICFVRTATCDRNVLTEQEWKECGPNAGFVNNITPDYYGVIAKGLLELRKSADVYGKRAIDSIIDLSDRYRDEAVRLGRGDIAAVLEQVPRYPARNFREALQFFRIIHFALWLEGDNHLTVGRFDKKMYPYLKADMERGVYTEETALALVEDFFLSFHKDYDLYFGVQRGDNGQSLMLGGVDENGKDCFNLLSALCLKASLHNGLIDPKINLRVGKNTPLERYIDATELTKAGLGFPQYCNDDLVIPALEKLGYAHRDAADYSVAACWEFIVPKVAMDVVNIAALSYPKSVDDALHEDFLRCDTFEEFFAAVKRRIKRQADEICGKIKSVYFVPTPFMTCINGFDANQGGTYNNFGIHGVGIATATDSLAAIRQYVYEEKRISREAFLRAVDSNFENDPVLLHALRYEAPKLGNNDDAVDGIAVALLDTFAGAFAGKRNCRGGLYRAGTGSAMFYLLCADEIGASPDGRRKGEPFGANFSVSLFAKVKGPVSVIGSMTKPHFENAINGGPLTLEFDQSVFAGQDGTEKVALLVKSFIDRGGHQLQLNTVNPDTLRDAQKHPENHRHLVVRVWGWSAYFVELDKKYQDHVMARQVYRI